MHRADGPRQVAGEVGQRLADEGESSRQPGLLGAREFGLPGQAVQSQDDGQRHQPCRMAAEHTLTDRHDVTTSLVQFARMRWRQTS